MSAPFEGCVRLVGVDLGSGGGNADVAEIVEDGRLVRHRLKISVKPVHEFFSRRPRSGVAVTDGKGAWWLQGAIASLGHEVVVVDPEQELITEAERIVPGSRRSEILACLLRDAPSGLRPVEPLSPATELGNAVTGLCNELQKTVRERLAEAGVAIEDGGTAELIAAWPGLAMGDELRAELQKTVDTMAELVSSADVVASRVRLMRDR